LRQIIVQFQKLRRAINDLFLDAEGRETAQPYGRHDLRDGTSNWLYLAIQLVAIERRPMAM
jgi:hypothetical protein